MRSLAFKPSSLANIILSALALCALSLASAFLHPANAQSELANRCLRVRKNMSPSPADPQAHKAWVAEYQNILTPCQKWYDEQPNPGSAMWLGRTILDGAANGLGPGHAAGIKLEKDGTLEARRTHNAMEVWQTCLALRIYHQPGDFTCQPGEETHAEAAYRLASAPRTAGPSAVEQLRAEQRRQADDAQQHQTEQTIQDIGTPRP